MLFKSFAHISRHASLAKSLWTSSSNPNPQPSFFVTTNQLARQQSQVAIRQPSGFGNGSSNSSSDRNPYTSACAGLANGSNFSTIVPLSSLDDDRQREVLLTDASGMHHNLLHGSRGGDRVSPNTAQVRRFSSSGTYQEEKLSKRDPRVSEVTHSNKSDQKSEIKAIGVEEDVAELESQEAEQSIPSDSITKSSKDLPETNDNLDGDNKLAASPSSPTIEQPVSEVSALLAEQKYNDVLDIFDSLRDSNITPELPIYNAALTSIAELCSTQNRDVMPLIDLYSQMLEEQVKPDTQTYTIVITGLLTAAKRAENIDEFLFARRGVLSAVDAKLEALDQASQYRILAHHIFAASNAVRSQNYEASLLDMLVNSCIHQQFDKVDEIVAAYQDLSGGIQPHAAAKLILAFGKAENLTAAQEVYSNAEKTDSVNAAMIAVYFSNLETIEGLKLYQSLLQESMDHPQSLGAVIVGFAKDGDCETAWNWIKQAEMDGSIQKIEDEVIFKVFDHVCEHGNVEVADQMFHYIASVQGFNRNDLRSKYAALCVNHGDVHKAVKECQIRGGLWDPATMVMVCSELAKEDIGMACQVFTAQSNRLYDHFQTLDRSYQYLGEEALAVFVNSLEPLPFSAAYALSNTAFISTNAFSMPYGQRILEALWEGEGSYAKTKEVSRLVTLDIIVLHNMWIKSMSSPENSLSVSQLDKVRTYYDKYVTDLIDQRSKVELSFSQQVRECLVALKLSTDKWDKFTSEGEFETTQQSDAPPSRPLPISPAYTPLNFSPSVSNQVLAYSQTKNGIVTALEKMESAFIRGELVAPEALYALLEGASNVDFRIVVESYRLMLDYLPHPSTSPEAWTIWVGIHRRMVQFSADKDYTMAKTAYANLKDMGSSPDATGYGHLISHAPVTSTRDEAGDAIFMFNEAKLMNVQPNTFLYNVLLSKLSKARRLKEAIAFYEDMGVTNTKKSSITYGTMISACCRAGDEEFARKLFDEMEASPNYVPRVAPFNIMLQYYVHNKRDRSQALNVYHRMRQAKVDPSAHTYKLLIDLHSTLEPVSLEEADKVLLQIKDDANAVTTQHFAALIFARGVGLKDLDSARQFYADLLKNNRVHPDKLVFQALLESYVVNDKVTETGEVLNDMVKYHVDMNAYMANILIRGWAVVNIAKSIGLFEYILSRKVAEPSSYESIIRAFIYIGDIQSAMGVLDSMRVNRYPEPVVAKVEALVAGAEFTGEEKDPSVLLESIFRQDAHRLVFA